jgi:hypothetical protein
LYEAKFTVSKVTDFGISLNVLRKDSPEIPDGGLHFHIAFDGHIKGERLSGSVRGVDHVHIRSDGSIALHIHGVISTPEGARIALSAEGTSTIDDNTGLLQVDQEVSLYSSFSDYQWVNGLPIHCVGHVLPGEDVVRLSAFT